MASKQLLLGREGRIFIFEKKEVFEFICFYRLKTSHLMFIGKACIKFPRCEAY